MKSFSGKELIKILERHGWRFLRICGSHHIYGKPGTIVKTISAGSWKFAFENRTSTASLKNGRIRRRY